MTEQAKDIEKSTFRALWQKLDHNQRRFAVAMLDSKSKKEAAESIDVKPNTVYNWDGDVDIVVELLQGQQREAVMEILTNEVAKAAMVKVAGLDSEEEIRRQDAATEILDRVLGKPTQRQEVSGPGGGAIAFADVSPRDLLARRLDSIAEREQQKRDSGRPDGQSNNEPAV